MLFRVHHRISYRYSRPVFLEPQTFRLRPRCDAGQRLLSFSLQLDPRPAGRTDCLDAEGNVVTTAWFDGLTESLMIDSRFEAEALRSNPYDFIITEPGVQQLPVTYPAEQHIVLAAALRVGNVGSVRDFARQLDGASKGITLSFLDQLCARLHRDWKVVVRPTGAPFPPERTLIEQQAACRDLAVLFVAACRAQGLAARFVSGYQQGDADQDERHLHAWAEVYLPGGGWRGYDPTHGLAVADGHVAVAASYASPLAAPVSGAFRGEEAQAVLDFDLRIVTEP